MIKCKRTNNGKWRSWYSGPQPEPQAQTVSQNYHPTLDGAITLPTPSVQGDSGAAALLKLEIGMLLLPLPLT